MWCCLRARVRGEEDAEDVCLAARVFDGEKFVRSDT
jgi:hypothetical protein